MVIPKGASDSWKFRPYVSNGRKYVFTDSIGIHFEKSEFVIFEGSESDKSI